MILQLHLTKQWKSYTSKYYTKKLRTFEKKKKITILKNIDFSFLDKKTKKQTKW